MNSAKVGYGIALGTSVLVVAGSMAVVAASAVSHAMRLRSCIRDVPAGQVSFDVTNMGSRSHELVILPLADSQQAGNRPPGADGKVDGTGSLGEATTACGAVRARASQGAAPAG